MPFATLAAGGVLLLTLAATGVAWRWFSVDEEQERRTELSHRARDAESRIVERVFAFEQVLHGAAGLLEAVQPVDRATFRRYVDALHLEGHYRTREGLGFARYEPGDPPRARVLFREPVEGWPDRGSVEDPYGDPVHREAMVRAREEGQPALTGRVPRAVEDARPGPGSLQVLYYPVFRADAGTPGPRQLAGWVFMPFAMADLLEGLLGERSAEVTLRIYDGERPTPDRLLFGPSEAPAAGGTESIRTFTIGGRRWTLVVRPLPAFDAQLADPFRPFLLLLGFVLSVSLTALVWSLATGRSRARRAAHEMNRDLLVAQEALRESENRLRRAARGGSVGLWDWDVTTGRITYDDTWASLLGHAPDGVKADVAHWDRLVHPEDLPAVRQAVEACLSGAQPSFTVEHRLRHREGSWVWMLARGAVVSRAPDGSATRAAGSHIEITERKLAEEALREGERFLRTVLETSLDGFWIVDPAGRLLDVNPSYCAMTGFSRDELLGRRLEDLEAPESGPSGPRLAELRRAGGGRFEAVHRRRDASPLHVDVSATFVGGGQGAMVCFVRDVTERHRAEERLRESEDRYRTLVDNLNAGVLVHEADTTIVLCNAKACFLLGLPAPHVRGRIAGDPAWGFLREDGTAMPPEEYPAVRAFTTGDPVQNVVVGFRRAGAQDLVWVLLNAHLAHRGPDRSPQLVVTFIDITRRKEAEEALQQSQRQLAIAGRMAAMGTLVAGVAHEINNPLAGTLSAQSFALDDLRAASAALRTADPADGQAAARAVDRALEALEDAEAGASRVARIVKDLTTFGRPDPRRSRVPLAEVVRGALRWIPASVGNVARVTVHDLGAPEVEASAGQIEQVVVNLVTNAARAMPPGRVGSIEVTVGEGPDGGAWLTVSDDGSGMTPEMVQRVFDPFFTTRPVGLDRGTGLGLSICHAIVTAHGGSLTASSELGKGSLFRMDLPGITEARPA